MFNEYILVFRLKNGCSEAELLKKESSVPICVLHPYLRSGLYFVLSPLHFTLHLIKFNIFKIKRATILVP